MWRLLTLVASLLCIIKAELGVHSPPYYKSEFENNSIGYSVANFGHIPFGKTLIGTLVTISPLDACDLSKIIVNNTYQMPFMLVKRGGCKFVQKVMNAEKMGAKMVIVMDDVQQVSKYITMKDDGNGYKVNIPSILVSDADGQKLMTLTNTKPIILKITFETKKSQKVDLSLWLEGNNRKSYLLVRDFAQEYEKVKQKINLNVIYHTTPCYFCKNTDCYGDGLYCAITHSENTKIDGQHILQQQVREKFVFKEFPLKWWKYVDKFDLECTSLLEAKVCSAKLFKQLDINTNKIESLVEQQLKNPTVMAEDKTLLDFSGILQYPGASVNSMLFRGNLKPKYLLQQICNSLIEPPESCREVIQMPQVQKDPSYTGIIILTVVIITVVFMVAFCIYRRHIRIKMGQEMNSQVNQMVSKYVTFYSERTNK